MSETLQTEQARREAEIRAKLPDDCTKLLDAAQTDPGAPFEPAAVAMLSKLRTEDPANWQRARSMLKAINGVTVGDLDRMTAPAGGESGNGKQGRPVEWDDPEPWPETVSGAAGAARTAARRDRTRTAAAPARRGHRRRRLPPRRTSTTISVLRPRP